MLQLHQRFMKFSTKNFRKIFRGIIPEKYRYFSGNFRKNSAASYERILIKYLGVVGCGPSINQLDSGGNLDRDPDPGFLNLDQDQNPEIFYCPALLISVCQGLF